MEPLLYTLYKYILIVCGLSCFAALKVEFNTTRSMYTVGDDVTLTCYVETGWLYVTIYRNDADIYDCYSTLGGCITPDNSPEPYIAKIIHSNPTIFINNVTFNESDVNFTCQWTSLYATVSFNVQADRTSSPNNPGEENMVHVVVIALVCIVTITAATVCCYWQRGISKKIPVYVHHVCCEGPGRNDETHSTKPSMEEDNACVTLQGRQQNRDLIATPFCEESGLTVTN